MRQTSQETLARPLDFAPLTCCYSGCWTLTRPYSRLFTNGIHENDGVLIADGLCYQTAQRKTDRELAVYPRHHHHHVEVAAYPRHDDDR